jgi:hypothetical protein
MFFYLYLFLFIYYKRYDIIIFIIFILYGFIIFYNLRISHMTVLNGNYFDTYLIFYLSFNTS